MIKLIKSSKEYYIQYKDMMDEWIDDGSRLAPWPLYLSYENEEKFGKTIEYIESVEQGINSDGRPQSTTYWLYDEENDRIIGLSNIRHKLVGEVGRLWGHIGYGVRPSERRKGYATLLLKEAMKEAEKLGINKIYVGAYSENIGSCKTIEKCGFTFDEIIIDEGCGKEIKKYFLDYEI